MTPRIELFMPLHHFAEHWDRAAREAMD